MVYKFSDVCEKRKFATIFIKALQFSLPCTILQHSTLTFKTCTPTSTYVLRAGSPEDQNKIQTNALVHICQGMFPCTFI